MSRSIFIRFSGSGDRSFRLAFGRGPVREPADGGRYGEVLRPTRSGQLGSARGAFHLGNTRHRVFYSDLATVGRRLRRQRHDYVGFDSSENV